jgi:hypothetical protein
VRGRVDPNRARRYIDRTNASAADRLDARARARGWHCAGCADNLDMQALHLTFSQLADSLRFIEIGGQL